MPHPFDDVAQGHHTRFGLGECVGQEVLDRDPALVGRAGGIVVVARNVDVRVSHEHERRVIALYMQIEVVLECCPHLHDENPESCS